MQRLTDAYNKSGNTSKGRNNIIQILALVLTRVGSTYLCENIDDIWNSLVHQIVAGPKGRSSPQQRRIAEAYVTFLIGNLVCRHILRESEQMDMVRYFMRHCSDFDLDPARSEQSLVLLKMSLKQLDCLLGSFGRSTLAEDVHIEKTLNLLSMHADKSIQTQARQCMVTYARCVTHRLPILTADIMENLETLLLALTENVKASNSLSGRAEVLSSLIAIHSSLPMYASRDMCTRAMSIAVQLLKAAGDQDLTFSTHMIRSAWEILGGLLSLPKRIMHVHLSQILLLWKNALPKASHREATTAETRAIEEWSFLLSIRAAALRSITCYLKAHIPKRSDGDLVRRIVTLLNHALAFNDSVPAIKCPSDDIVQSLQVSKLEASQAEFVENLLKAFHLIASHPLVDSSRVALCNLCMLQMTRRETLAAPLQTSLHQTHPVDGFWDGIYTVPAIASNDETGMLDDAAPIFGRECSLAFKEYIIEYIPRKPGNIIHADCIQSEHDHGLEASEKAAILVDTAAQLFAALFPLLATPNQMEYIQRLTERVQAITNASSRSEKTLSLPLASLLGAVTLVARSLAEVRKVSNSVDDSLLARMRDLLQVRLAPL